MVAEPVIYLVVWSTIADQSGGSVQRAHAGLLRRLLHRLDARPEHEHRLHAVRLGVADPRGRALRPAPAPAASDPLRHRLLRGLEGRRDRALDPDRASRSRSSSIRRSTSDRVEIVVFAVAIWGAYLIRTFIQSALGMLCFWTTRGRSDLRPLHHARAPALGPARPAAAHARLGADARLVPPVPVDVLLPDRGARRRPLDAELLARARRCRSSGSCVGHRRSSRLAWRHAIRRYSAVGTG